MASCFIPSWVAVSTGWRLFIAFLHSSTDSYRVFVASSMRSAVVWKLFSFSSRSYWIFLRRVSASRIVELRVADSLRILSICGVRVARIWLVTFGEIESERCSAAASAISQAMCRFRTKATALIAVVTGRGMSVVICVIWNRMEVMCVSVNG